MLDYLPELLKGLHTSLTLTVASIIVALILSLILTIILTLNAGAGMDSSRLYHLVYRYAAAGADIPDLLRRDSFLRCRSIRGCGILSPSRGCAP